MRFNQVYLDYEDHVYTAKGKDMVKVIIWHIPTMQTVSLAHLDQRIITQHILLAKRSYLANHLDVPQQMNIKSTTCQKRKKTRLPLGIREPADRRVQGRAGTKGMAWGSGHWPLNSGNSSGAWELRF